MVLSEIHSADPVGDADRRGRIIQAAERAFVRHGFHATTMQHVAAEAAMSPGNLYRYFRSKEAIVQELCAREQADRASSFAAFAEADSVIAAMAEGLRRNLLGKPREKMQMILEIGPRRAAIAPSRPSATRSTLMFTPGSFPLSKRQKARARRPPISMRISPRV